MLELDLSPEHFAVARFDPNADVPGWAQASPFLSITRTPRELSVICHESVVPLSMEAQRGFRCLGARGPLSFAESGILESLARPLAEAGVSIFTLSTYEADYLPVRNEALVRALDALSEAGHAVHRMDAV